MADLKSRNLDLSYLSKIRQPVHSSSILNIPEIPFLKKLMNSREISDLQITYGGNPAKL